MRRCGVPERGARLASLRACHAPQWLCRKHADQAPARVIFVLEHQALITPDDFASGRCRQTRWNPRPSTRSRVPEPGNGQEQGNDRILAQQCAVKPEGDHV
jgi:hypothetical protein